MQRTLNEICTVIADQLGKPFDDPFKRMLAVRVDAWRSTLISRSLEKDPSQRPNFVQPLYLNLESASLVNNCTTSVPLCPISQTVDEIPAPLRTSQVRFDYIGSIDGMNPFREAASGTLEYMSSGRYSGRTIYYQYISNRIQILNKSKLPSLRIDTVFDRPTDVLLLNCQNGVNCDVWNLPYPATSDTIQMIIQFILEVDYGQRFDNKSREVEVKVP